MSTFLSNSRRDNEIKDVKELSEQNEISYGVLINGSTYKFFEVHLTCNKQTYHNEGYVIRICHEI